MPELRKDPIVGRWVIIATDRAKRPVTPKLETPNPGGLLSTTKVSRCQLC